MTPTLATDFSLGNPVTIVLNGMTLYEGIVAEHPSPYSVIIQTKTGFRIMAATSLIHVKGDAVEDLIIEQMQLIDELTAKRAAAVQALETYFIRTFGERRPLRIDDVNLRDLAEEVFRP